MPPTSTGWRPRPRSALTILPTARRWSTGSGTLRHGLVDPWQRSGEGLQAFDDGPLPAQRIDRRSISTIGVDAPGRLDRLTAGISSKGRDSLLVRAGEP